MPNGITDTQTIVQGILHTGDCSLECIAAHHAQQVYRNIDAKGHDLLGGNVDGKGTALGIGHLLGREHRVAGRQL